MILFMIFFSFSFAKVFLWSGLKLGVAKATRSLQASPSLADAFFYLILSVL